MKWSRSNPTPLFYVEGYMKFYKDITLAQRYDVREEQAFIRNAKRLRSKEVANKAMHCSYHKKMKGDICYLCPICFDRIDTTIECEMKSALTLQDPDTHCFVTHRVHRKCWSCRNEVDFIELDPNIGKVVQMLNKKGYYTKFCCEGHGKYNPYISFDQVDILDHVNTLPLEWELDERDYYSYGGIVLRAVAPKWEWRQAIYVLQQWANSLPYVQFIYHINVL